MWPLKKRIYYTSKGKGIIEQNNNLVLYLLSYFTLPFLTHWHRKAQLGSTGLRILKYVKYVSSQCSIFALLGINALSLFTKNIYL